MSFELQVDLPRSIFSREQVKQMHNFNSRHKEAKKFYRGITGRKMKFEFPDEETKTNFITIFNQLFSNIKPKQ